MFQFIGGIVAEVQNYLNKEIRRELKIQAQIAIRKSAKIYNWRGPKAVTENGGIKYEPLWTDEKTRDGRIKNRMGSSH